MLVSKSIPLIFMLSSFFAFGGSSSAAADGVEHKFQLRATAAPRTEHNYHVAFTSADQRSVGDLPGDSEAAVYGLPGSVFSTGTSGITALTGSLAFESGQKELRVYNQLSTITLAPSSRILCTCVQPKMFYLTLGNGSATANTVVGTSTLTAGKTYKIFRKDDDVITQECEADPAVKALTNPSAKWTQPARIIAKPGAEFTVIGKVIQLNRGSIFVDAPALTEINTALGRVSMQKRSLVVTRIFGKELFIENCTVPGDIKFQIGQYNVVLGTGRELVVAPRAATADIIPLDGIPRRKFITRSNGSLTVITADFNPLAIMLGLDCVRTFLREPISSAEKKLGNYFIKGTAALLTVTKCNGEYVQTPDKLTVLPLSAIN